MHPKVFISHASEDKDRFVTEFAAKLRANGVDAWLDKWEMLPGDSLVDKIFEEGLKEAEAVIIILSSNSVEKPWVREELNASIVNRISKGTKIIPVVLDKCKVPESLTSTLWQSIINLNSYDDDLNRIISSIFGATDKPALGSSPAHASSKYNEIGGLTKADNLVLKTSCEFIIEKNDIMIDPEILFSDGSKLGFNRGELKDCIEVLENHGYLDVSRYLGGGKDSYKCNYQVTTYGFDKYSIAYIDGYNTIIENIVSAIVNENIDDNNELASKVGEPIVIVDHILDVLESNGHIKLSKSLGGTIDIYHISASLRRALSSRL
jgi:hypothetical protein